MSLPQDVGAASLSIQPSVVHVTVPYGSGLVENVWRIQLTAGGLAGAWACLGYMHPKLCSTASSPIRHMCISKRTGVSWSAVQQVQLDI